MSLRILTRQAAQYTLIGIMLAASAYLSAQFSDIVHESIALGAEHTRTLYVLICIVVVFSLGFVVYELAKPTAIPSFVLAIIFGFVTRGLLLPLTENPVSLTTLTTIGAILILFGGGLETPFMKFRKLMKPILSIALIGTLINAFLLSSLLLWLARWFGIPFPLEAAVLLGAAIASTDPAAIIPSFDRLHFTETRVKHIAISESAINDVVSAVLVSIFLAVFVVQNYSMASVTDAYALLLNWENSEQIFRYVLIGILSGAVSFGALHLWTIWKNSVIRAEEGTNSALFLAVPLFAFTLAEIFGGSGFLAVFLAGLFFHIREHFKHVEHYFTQTIEGFMKPMIFMLLGAIVEPESMVAYSGYGIVVGLLFMFVLRPLIVFITLSPFHFWGSDKMRWKELCFLSFVRETGVIPAVLLISIRLTEIPGSDLVVTIGLWVILLTLLIEPPFTPCVARSLGVARDQPPLPQRMHAGPVAVLCSRGFSFPERMQTVVDWAHQHSVDNVVLLHSPEEKYSKQFVHDVEEKAREVFVDMNVKLEKEGKKHINFEFLCGPGTLQENIEQLIHDGDVSIIFVGNRMLDYRMEHVKELAVPFFFMP